MPAVIALTALAFVTACVATDLHARRIPNLLSFPAAIAGIMLNGVYLGLAGIGLGIAGFALMVALLFVPFALGGIGAGDVKMMGAAGALLGPRLALVGLVAGMILGGVIVAAYLARRGKLEEKLLATATMFAQAIRRRSLAPLRLSAADAGAVALPYSLPLGLGIVTALAVSLV